MAIYISIELTVSCLKTFGKYLLPVRVNNITLKKAQHSTANLESFNFPL